MGWDFSMEEYMGHGDPAVLEECSMSYTFNVAPMFFKAFDGTPISHDGIRGLDGFLGCDAAPIIRVAIGEMLDDPDAYLAMEPTNRWGSYKGALNVLVTLLQWCTSNEQAIMRVE